METMMESRLSAIEGRLDSFISDIESRDSPIGPVLHSVYEDDSQAVFLDKLQQHSNNHEKEIERMCNFHYQGFVEAVNELVRVRSDANELKLQVKRANVQLQDSGQNLLVKLEELATHRERNRNIAATIETLTLCIPVLEMFAKLHEQKKSKRYYPALKTLEQLEHTYLARIKNFRFAELMICKLPEFREGIKDAAKEDLMLFLENVRSKGEKLGEIAMKQAHQQYSLSLLYGVDDGFDDHDIERELCCTDLVDFSPVYRCIHIFTALGQKEFFEQYYRKERLQQARLAFDWQRGTAIIHQTLHIFQAYFNQIVGFFVVEDNVMNTIEGLVTRGNLEELWELAVSKIGAVLRTQCCNLDDVSMMLAVKELVVWFSHTLSSYGFSVNALYEVLLQMRDQYNDLLANKWRPKFDEQSRLDNYTPLYVETLEEFTDNIQKFPYTGDVSLDQFPKRFPFSSFVPNTYAEIKNFVYASMKFNENLNISRTETDNFTRKCASLLLTKTLNESVKETLCDPNLSLAQLAQIAVNTMHLEDSCPHLEKFISQLTGTTDVSVNLARLYGVSTFKDIRADVEMQIYDVLNKKMDEFLSLAHYDWSPATVKLQPSSYLVDLIAYLQGAFISFEPLPGDVAKTACMSSCKHLAANLKGFLLDEKTERVNMNGLLTFDVDLQQCEIFASSTPIKDFPSGTLEMTFMELRQMTDLFLVTDWEVYFLEYGRTGARYDRVTPTDALRLVEKMMDNTKKINFKKADRERKKYMDGLVKQLKDLI